MDRVNIWGLMNALVAIVNSSSCDDAEVTLAKHFLLNYRHLSDLNIYDVAEECFVSRATARRMSQSLGFENFKGMKARYEEFHESFSFYRTPMGGDSTTMAQQLYMMARDMDAQIKGQPMEQLAERIADSREVIFVSSDLYSGQSSNFQKAMIFSGKMVRVVSNVYENNAVLKGTEPEDLLILTSVSGAFARKTLELIRKLNAYKLLLTTCRAPELEDAYNEVRYMSRTLQSQTRNVYALFGVEYYLENIFSAYLKGYAKY